MKKMMAALLIGSLLLAAGGCAMANRSKADKMAFYYCAETIAFHTPNSVIAAEMHSAEEIGTNMDSIINAYLRGPTTSGLVLLFPNDISLVCAQIVDDTLQITLGKECADMTEMDLTLGCSALAKTLFPYTDAAKISFDAEDGFTHLEDALIITRENVLTDDVAVQTG